MLRRWLALLSLSALLAGCRGPRGELPAPAAPGPADQAVSEPGASGAEGPAGPSEAGEPSGSPGREGERAGEQAGERAGERLAERPTEPGASRTIEIEVPGFEPSFVVVPGGNETRPLVVAAHGAWDRADWFCSVMGEIVKGRAFVLCPTGKRVSVTQPGPYALYFYPTHFFLEREIEAAIGAMRAAFGPRLDDERAVYVGFSQGAIMGSLVVVRNPRRFPRALLIEGAYLQGQWEGAMGQMFRRGGGERVLLVCGGWLCGGRARESAQVIERAGAKAKVVVSAGGHTYGGPVQQAVASAFGWVVEGDSRWN